MIKATTGLGIKKLYTNIIKTINEKLSENTLSQGKT